MENKKNFESILYYFLTLAKVNPFHLPVLFRSFWGQVNRYFDSKEAREIVSLVSFFLGRTPFNTMGIYTLLSYTEFKYDGYYNVEGGMYKIVEGLISELEKENVEIIYNTEIVDFIENNGSLDVLVDKNGNIWKSDVVIINADSTVFRNSVFKRRKYSDCKLKEMDWTMGYLTIYLGIKSKLNDVHHHNYFLGNNFKDYSNNILKNPDKLDKPYYHVNILSRNNQDCAPKGSESLFFVCPVPNLLYKTNWDDKENIANMIIADFSKRIGKDIRDDIVTKTIYTPIDWENQYNLYKGSGLGLAHTMRQIGGFRPPNYDEKFKNVFYVGASTIPGAGLPMSVISSKLVVERVENYIRKNI
jgi:phytoene desaturase